MGSYSGGDGDGVDEESSDRVERLVAARERQEGQRGRGGRGRAEVDEVEVVGRVGARIGDASGWDVVVWRRW